MRTHKELEAWIAYCAHDKGEGTAKQKTWWFVALQLAAEEGQLTYKERAETLLNGIAPMSDDDVDLWLKNRTDDAMEQDEPIAEWDASLVRELETHFGMEHSS